MALDYLDFEYSEDDQGVGTFDAMASTRAAQAVAVRAEVAQVLGWAHAEFPESCAPLEEGGEWSYDLQSVQEFSVPEQMDYDTETRQLVVHPGVPGAPRHTLSLSVSGSPVFCAAFRQAFGID